MRVSVLGSFGDFTARVEVSVCATEASPPVETEPRVAVPKRSGSCDVGSISGCMLLVGLAGASIKVGEPVGVSDKKNVIPSEESFRSMLPKVLLMRLTHLE